MRKLRWPVIGVLLLSLLSACSTTQSIGSPAAAGEPISASTPTLTPPPTHTPAPSAIPTVSESTAAESTATEPVVVEQPDFDGARAFEHLRAQVAFGPRPVGSDALRQTADYILAQLALAGWETETQEFEHLGLTVRNLIGRNALGRGPVIILGAHYDTRFEADQDPESPQAPVLGANDAASGVAVLLELARALDLEAVDNEIWLAFFDAEDNGGLRDWDWIVGSSYMAAHLEIEPLVVIVVDMIGDAEQQIFFDHSSHQAWSALIWDTASSLGYEEHFTPTLKYSMLDDHTPFARLGLPAVDIIDFDYPYWHTAEDTLDKVSADSLERVGRTLEVILENGLTP